jgi:multidrug efflux pump subunit AcrA (membrane-fusion protein)
MKARKNRLTALAALLLSILPAFAADNPVADVHELTLQWTGIEHQKDLLRANWRNDKPVLEQQLALFEREARELEALLETTARQQDEVEQRRLELLEQQTRYEQEQAALESTLVQAGNHLHTLHPQLPPPLLDAWEMELPRLDDPLLTAGERLQLALDLLRQLDDFQKRVTLHETVMTLADGQDYLVQQVYLGLSHGWYVTADRQFAASGMATADGWQWTPLSDGAPVTLIVDILEKRRIPELVSIPLRLNVPSAAGGN